MKSQTFKDKDATEKWIKSLAKDLTRPCVLLLDGDLGAGKTQTVRWLVEALGGEQATSPTFAFHHAYSTPSGVVDHVDLYRLTGDSDLESTGFWDLLKNEKCFLIVEWASRLPTDVWPEPWRKITLRISRSAGTSEGRRIDFDL